MQRLALLSIIASANAAAVLDILAEPCTGSGTPKAELANGIVGICFGGGASVLSVSEQAVLQVKSYDTTTGEGTIRVDAEGMQTIHCPPATFKKLNNEAPITVDLSACGKIHKAIGKDLAWLSPQAKARRVQLEANVPVIEPRLYESPISRFQAPGKQREYEWKARAQA